MKLRPWQLILLAMIAAVIVGSLINANMVTERNPVTEFTKTGALLVEIFDYIGNMFMALLKMIIVPLVFSSVVVGIAKLGGTDGFARMGAKTLGYYVLTSFIAIIIGLSMVNIFKPGLKDGKPNEAIAAQIESNKDAYADTIAKKVGDGGQDLDAVYDIFLRMIPQNIFEAFGSNGKMLSLIFLSLVVGIGLIFISEKGRGSLLGFFEGVNELSLLITNWIMLLAPIGVFALVAETTAQAGLPIVLILGKYFCVVAGALLLHLFVVMPLILTLLGRVNPFRHFYAMRNALLTAFSTSSSSATLPVTMRALQENAGVSNRVSSFVLPLGATVNMDGTALYECIAVIFISQVVTGGDMTLGQQLTVVMLSLLTSIGVAGVPSASLVAIVIIVNNLKIPNAEAVIGLLLAVDRPLDMLRTAVNVFSDSCGAVVIAKSEGEDVLTD